MSDRAAEVVLDALKKGHIPARARILEVGCGNGRFLRALGARDGAHGLRVSGVDILPSELPREQTAGVSERGCCVSAKPATHPKYYAIMR